VTIDTFIKLKTAFWRWLWRTDLDAMPWVNAFAVRTARLIYVLIRDVSQGQLTLRAMSLVYTTLLSLVPLLALSFSVLKAFGVHNQIKPLLMNLFEPLGEQGAELATRIIDFVENISVGVLGSVGLVLLIYTAVTLIQKIEEAFNFLWHITTPRHLATRLSGYIGVVLVGPLLIVTALGIIAAITSTALVQHIQAIEPFGTLFTAFGKVLPYLLVIAAFTVMYLVVPNTRVRFVSALLGGVVAGVLWGAAGWAFASFIANSAQYKAVYSGFAIVILFLFWLYISWAVLLVGVAIAFYHQNPAYQRADSADKPLGHRARLSAALEIMRLIGESYQRQTPHLTLEALCTRLSMPMQPVHDIVQALHERAILARTDDDPPYLIPNRDLAAITIKDIFDAVGSEEAILETALNADSRVREVMAEFDTVTQEHFGARTVEDLLNKRSLG
jgi:membrane protein